MSPEHKERNRDALINVAYLTIFMPFFLIGPGSEVMPWYLKCVVVFLGVLSALALRLMIINANRG